MRMRGQTTLALDADTGDVFRYNATLVTPNSVTGIIGNWNNTIRLPCISIASGDAAMPDCSGFQWLTYYADSCFFGRFIKDN